MDRRDLLKGIGTSIGAGACYVSWPAVSGYFTPLKPGEYDVHEPIRDGNNVYVDVTAHVAGLVKVRVALYYNDSRLTPYQLDTLRFKRPETRRMEYWFDDDHTRQANNVRID